MCTVIRQGPGIERIRVLIYFIYYFKKNFRLIILRQIYSYIYEILQRNTDGKPQLFYLIFLYIRGNIIVLGKSAPFIM